MEEAKYSLNIKYRHQGFDCQFTIRGDTGLAQKHLEYSQLTINWLLAHGAVPGNGNGSHKKEPE